MAVDKNQPPPLSALRTYSEEAGSPNYSVHGMTGVDKLHAAGIKGKGVTIAIVDTGVDYNHPTVSSGSFLLMAAELSATLENIRSIIVTR